MFRVISQLWVGSNSAITLVGEADRAMLKAVIKRSSRTEGGDDSIRHRLLPDDAVKTMLGRLEDIKDEVSEVLKEEKLEKEVSFLPSNHPSDWSHAECKL